MSQVGAELIIKGENVFQGEVVKEGKFQTRYVGFDQYTVPYLSIGMGSRLVDIDRRGVSEELFLEVWLKKARQGITGGLRYLGATIEDVADAYNRRLAYRAQEEEVLGDAVKIVGNGKLVIPDEAAIWRRLLLNSGDKAYILRTNESGTIEKEEI